MIEKISRNRLKDQRFVRPGCGTNNLLLSAEHLIADFLYLQDKLGRRPKISDYLHHCHTPKVLDRVFGKPGWRRLIKAIGKKVMPKSYRLNAEHLIQDYLDTAHAIGRKPSYSHFHARHRHSLKVLIRVFGKPGWSNLRKAAAGKKRKAGVRAHGLSTGAAATVRESADKRFKTEKPSQRFVLRGRPCDFAGRGLSIATHRKVKKNSKNSLAKANRALARPDCKIL